MVGHLVPPRSQRSGRAALGWCTAPPPLVLVDVGVEVIPHAAPVRPGAVALCCPDRFHLCPPPRRAGPLGSISPQRCPGGCRWSGPFPSTFTRGWRGRCHVGGPFNRGDRAKCHGPPPLPGFSPVLCAGVGLGSHGVLALRARALLDTTRARRVLLLRRFQDMPLFSYSSRDVLSRPTPCPNSGATRRRPAFPSRGRGGA